MAPHRRGGLALANRAKLGPPRSAFRSIVGLSSATGLAVLVLAVGLSYAAGGETTLVSRASGVGGLKGNSSSTNPSISAGGRYVAFRSLATNLSPDDPDGSPDVFVRDVTALTTTLVSRASGVAGAKGNGASQSPFISADGGHVAFGSNATNISPADPDTTGDAYVRDLQASSTTLVSRATGVAGAKGNGGSTPRAISANGRHVLLESLATNLSPDDPDSTADIYRRDLEANTTTYVSRPTGNAQKGNGASTLGSVSADGRYAAFRSEATNLAPADADATGDIFVRDLQANTTTLVSRATGVGGAKGNGVSGNLSMSADGRYVAFESLADNLSPDDPDTAIDVYVRDLGADTTTLVSRAGGAAGPKGNRGSLLPSISPDGRYVAFLSPATNLTPDDTDTVGDIFVRDLRANTTTLVSRAGGPAGAKGNGTSTLPSISVLAGHIAFESTASNLSPGDTEGIPDIFLRDLSAPCADADSDGDKDDDRDGLCDNWETNGIDADGDGTVDLRLYDVDGNGTIGPTEDADPNHKDAYLEIDFMAQHRPDINAVNDVIGAFAIAPVANPDGAAGVRLHVQVDEQAAVHNPDIAFPPCTGAPAGGAADFDTIKRGAFGTAAERVLGDKPTSAKRFAFRYSLYAHDLQGLAGISGCAERPGNDFVVSMGSWTAIGGHGVGNRPQQAGTLMHEMGHTFGLGHGGSDIVNCKPNYLSVMSYSRQIPGSPIVGVPLDYSRATLATLDEANLDEPAGIGGPAGNRTAYGPGIAQVDPSDAPLDWNRDGDTADAGVAADINRIPANGCPSAGVSLSGFDDWANLRFDLRNTIDFADGMRVNTPATETFTYDLAKQASSDTDADGIDDFEDNCPTQANADQADSDGDQIGEVCEPPEPPPAGDSAPGSLAAGTTGSGGSGAPTAVQISGGLSRELKAIASALKRVGIRRLVRRGGLSVTLNALAAGRFTITAATVVANARRAGAKRRTVVLLTGSKTIPRAGKATLRLRLTKRGKRALRRRNSVRITLRLAFVDRSGTRISERRTLRLPR